MLKWNGRIVGLSCVHDYVHRPENLDDLSLYDWVSTYKRGKLPSPTKTKSSSVHAGSLDDEAAEGDATGGDHEEDIVRDEATDSDSDNDGNEGRSGPSGNLAKNTAAKGMLRFTVDHPLFATHGLKCLPCPLVPNFVGQTLPRRDQGDREFYCTTMLTLFKPWRVGTTLKTNDASWDEAFTAHKFTDRQEEIMKNFNIRYECLDQRDDFMSELKKGATAVPGLINSDLVADEMDQTAVLDKTSESVNDIAPNNIDIL